MNRVKNQEEAILNIQELKREHEKQGYKARMGATKRFEQMLTPEKVAFDNGEDLFLHSPGDTAISWRVPDVQLSPPQLDLHVPSPSRTLPKFVRCFRMMCSSTFPANSDCEIVYAEKEKASKQHACEWTMLPAI